MDSDNKKLDKKAELKSKQDLNRMQHFQKKVEGVSKIKGKALLALFSIVIIILAASGKKISEKAIKNPKDEESKKLILRNQKISQFCLGLGSGLLTYVLLSFKLNAMSIVLLGLIFAIMSGITIQSFSKLDKDIDCKDKIQDTYGIMYGIMGAACGMISGGIFVSGLEGLAGNTRMTPYIIAGMMMCVLNIFLCSININTANNSSANINKTFSIVMLVISILSFIGSGVFLFKSRGSV